MPRNRSLILDKDAPAVESGKYQYTTEATIAGND